MNPASATAARALRPAIIERRERLRSAAKSVSTDYLNGLLAEIDAALDRIDAGSYGICETCHGSIEADRLERNPMLRFCLDHLSEEERRAHEDDLALAARIQSNLLPPKESAVEGWEVHYRYEPAGAVGGDYCETIPLDNGKSLFFAVGDIAGKGVAASLLMTHLSAIFRSLLSLDLPLAEVMSRANRLFCDSTPVTHYATLACGRASAGGVQLANAGHCAPMLLRRHATERLDSTGLPLGLFPGVQYTVRNVGLDGGDSLVLFSDGISEAQDPAGFDYGEARLLASARKQDSGGAAAMAEGILRDLAVFRAGREASDDVTLLILRRRS